MHINSFSLNLKNVERIVHKSQKLFPKTQYPSHPNTDSKTRINSIRIHKKSRNNKRTCRKSRAPHPPKIFFINKQQQSKKPKTKWTIKKEGSRPFASVRTDLVALAREVTISRNLSANLNTLKAAG